MKAKRLLAFALIGGCASIVCASGPAPISDDQLARWPVIVIGYWPKAKIVPHFRREGDTIQELEHHTRLVVTKVLHGNLAPGNHHLMYGYGISWFKDGKGLNSNSSTLSFGDAQDVSKPCIWFLEWAQSWDKKDKRWLLKPRQFQCVQETSFLSYYETLRRPDRNEAIAACLQDSDPRIVERSLNFINGWEEPWPFLPFRYLWLPESRRYWGEYPKPRALRQHLGLVGKISEGKLNTCKALAVATFAKWAGRSSIPKLRRQLKDPYVSAVAAGYLIRFKDVASAAGIEAACRRNVDSGLTQELALAIQVSGEEAFVPCLFPFLDNTSSSGFGVSSTGGVDACTPAVYAKESLKQLTGFTFPFDSQASLRAWQSVKAEQNNRTLVARLKSLLGDWEAPLTATYRAVHNATGSLVSSKTENDVEYAIVEFAVKNSSVWPLTLPKSPTGLDFAFENSLGNAELLKGKSGYVTLRPGQVFTFPGTIDKKALVSPKPPKVWIQYLDGARLGKRKWVGVVTAERAP